MKKIMALLLSIASLLSISSCNNSNTDSSSSFVDSTNQEQEFDFSGSNTKYNNHGDVKGSIHKLNQTETNDYFINNGTTSYKIVIANDASNEIIVYVKDLIALINEATNLTLEYVYEKDFKENDKFISIGNTSLFKKSGITLDYDELKSQGYVIKTINKAIYMNGFTDSSCAYAIYQFLTMTVNYEFYGPNTYYIDKNVSSIKLMNYDVVDAPDIEYRMTSYNFAQGASVRKYRLTIEDAFMSVNGVRWHNTFEYFPKATYLESNPEWYSDDGTQLCYTAHGNKESRLKMIEHVSDVIKESMIANPSKNVITFTIQDSDTFCSCTTCKNSKIKYNGANSAVIIQFLNEVSNNINSWFKAEGKEYERDLKILFFAYLSTNVAPVNYDSSTNTYSPVDSSVVCNDDVCVFFADIRGDYTHSYYDETSANDIYIKNMKAWTSVSKTFFFWTYSTNFRYYLTPYNSFNAMQETYKFAVECNTAYLYDQAQYNQGQSATGWSFLKEYLTSKLLWNVNLNQDALINNFFANFYSNEASTIMKQLFDEYRVLATYQTDVLGFSGASSIYHNALKSEYWPKNTLLKWINMFDDALKAIEPLRKKDVGAYQTYYSNITSERVAYVYLLLKIYNASLSNDELTYYKKLFHDDAEGNGMIYEGENGSLISDILK